MLHKTDFIPVHLDRINYSNADVCGGRQCPEENSNCKIPLFSHYYYTIRPVQQCVIEVNENPEELIVQ